MGSNEQVFAILLLSGIVGILLAILEQMLYEQGILINEFITGTVTLPAIQLVTILIAELFGLAIVAITQ